MKNQKRKKKGGFFKSLKKKVVGDSDDEDDEGGDTDDDMQADIDRIMRGKVNKPTAQQQQQPQSKPMSLSERAALQHQRAAQKK